MADAEKERIATLDSFTAYMDAQLRVLSESLAGELRRLLREDLSEEQLAAPLVAQPATPLRLSAPPGAVIRLSSSSPPRSSPRHSDSKISPPRLQRGSEERDRSDTSSPSAVVLDLPPQAASNQRSGSKCSSCCSESSGEGADSMQGDRPRPEAQSRRRSKKSLTWVAVIPEEEEEDSSRGPRDDSAAATYEGRRRKSAPDCLATIKECIGDRGRRDRDCWLKVRRPVPLPTVSSLNTTISPCLTMPVAVPRSPSKGSALLSPDAVHPQVSSCQRRTSSCSGHSIGSCCSGRSAANSAAQLQRFGVLPGSLRPSTNEDAVVSVDNASLLGVPTRVDTCLSNGNGHFAVLPVWVNRPQNRNSVGLFKRRGGGSRLDAWVETSMDPTDLRRSTTKSGLWTRCRGYPRTEQLCRFVLASPQGRRRLVWDLLALLFVAHDALAIPLQFLDWGQAEDHASRLTAWAARIFWTFDLLAGPLSGYERADGSFEGRLGPMVMHYAFTWLLPDVLLVGASWAEVFITADRNEGRWLYLLQMLRMLRLVRLVRVRTALAVTFARIRSERVSLLASIMQCMVGLVLVMHIMACLFVGLGNRGKTGWVEQAGYAGDGPWAHYMVAFHWSVSQFYGSMDLQPHTASERIFAIGALLNGFFIATAFVSSVTSSMTRLYMITSQQAAHLRLLGNYLQERGISARLSSRVQMNAKHVLEEQQHNIEETDVELLQLVSEPLRVELHFEVHSPLLSRHPLFDRLLLWNPAVMRQVCHRAVATMKISQDDVLFSIGEVPACPKMLFVVSGELGYSQDGKNHQSVMPGEWVCESVLWTDWVYHGALTAKTDCRLITLDALSFQEIGGQCQMAELEVGNYAAQFVKLLNASPNMRSDLGSSTDVSSLVALAYAQEEPSAKTIQKRPSFRVLPTDLSSVTPRLTSKERLTASERMAKKALQESN